MVTVQTMPTLSPCQVEDFKPGAKRSVKGALHLKPSAVKVLTTDEWEHIKEHHKGLASKMRVVSETKSQPAPASKKAAASTTEGKPKPAADEAKAEAKTEDKAEAEAAEDVEAKPKGGLKRKKVKSKG